MKEGNRMNITIFISAMVTEFVHNVSLLCFTIQFKCFYLQPPSQLLELFFSVVKLNCRF